MSCEKAFMEALRARGFRFTPQREMILEVLHHMPGHSTAEEIYSRVQELSSRVDIATLYRTLELLQELEFVNVIDMGAHERRYELVGVNSPHPHLGLPLLRQDPGPGSRGASPPGNAVGGAIWIYGRRGPADTPRTLCRVWG